MTVSSVVVLRDAADADLGIDLDLPQYVLTMPVAATSPLSVIANADIHRIDPPAAMLLITIGSTAKLLPAIAFAQRTAHRAIAGYILINPELPPPAQDWPDAPVLVLSTDGSDITLRDARLRGWQCAQTSTPQELRVQIRRHFEAVNPF